MSSEQDQIRSLAERIARRLSSQPESENGAAAEGDELSALRTHLSEIQQRLAHLESHIKHDDSCAQKEASHTAVTTQDAPRQAGHAPDATAMRSSWLSGTYVPVTAHPSLEKFTGIGEAVSELVDFLEREKVCSVEPGQKPCDQCGMCSSRGF